MKKFLIKIGLFFFPISIYIVFAINILPNLLKKTQGPNTRQQLEVSFNNVLHKDFDLLVLGNSRLYRGVNPDKLAIASYNFSHDNDSYNQSYFKLKHLENNNINYDYLILGIDYFQFSFKSDTRNYIYGELLGNKYLDDFESNLFTSKFSQFLNMINPKILLRLRPKKTVPIIKENGQYIRNGKASLNDKVKRDISRLSFQVEYFNEIIKYCKKNNIELFFVMLPTRENELESYSLSQMKEFDNFIKDKNITFWNFSLDTSYSVDNYTDITHFNSKTADRFSLQLNDSINKYVRTHNNVYKKLPK
jgi:hypothetical protein